MVTALLAAITAALLLRMLTKAVIALCFDYRRKDTALTNVSGECSKNIVGFSRPKARIQALVYGIWYLLIVYGFLIAEIHIFFENRNGYLAVLLFSSVSLSASPPFAIPLTPFLFLGLLSQFQF